MQETWAIHGVYPAMAWTPDSKSLVFWAGGKIQRIDVAIGAGADDPVPRRTTRAQVAKAVRFPVEVAPERFDVKMLRWVEVSPDGDQVVYEALGHLWISDLPAGHAAAADQAERPLRALSRPGRATASSDRLHHLGRREAGHRPRRVPAAAARAGW